MDHYNTSSVTFNNSTTAVINEILKIAIPCSYEISNDHIPCVGFSPIISTCLCRAIDRRYVTRDNKIVALTENLYCLRTQAYFKLTFQICFINRNIIIQMADSEMVFLEISLIKKKKIVFYKLNLCVDFMADKILQFKTKQIEASV